MNNEFNNNMVYEDEKLKKEINQINNNKLKSNIANLTANLLLNQNIILQEELINLSINYGYIYTKENGEIEALFKTICNAKTNYLAIQKNKLSIISISEEQYNKVIKDMISFHPCLRNDVSDELSEKSQRKDKNNYFIEQQGIAINPNLSCLYTDSDVTLKSFEEVCKKAMATLITIQVACDINQGGDYNKSVEVFSELINIYNIGASLNSKELKIFNGSYTRQDAIDLDWAYETYWALCWYLGLVDDISDASLLCDCNRAINFVIKCKNFTEFMHQCKPRTLEELLDMHDLYYRYNWAINEKKINPETNIGNLNSSIVIERRRGLEWILSNVDDWYSLQLNA